MNTNPFTKFVAVLDFVQGYGWRVSCTSTIDELSDIYVENIDPEVFETRFEARHWAHIQAANRGFERLSIKEPLHQH